MVAGPGVQGWSGHCGSAQEQGLAAADLGLDAPGVVPTSDWSVQRYATMTELTGGQLLPFHDPSCALADPATALAAVLAAR